MGKRHEVIGIKQAIRYEWMQKAAHLLLAGLDAKTIRQELHDYLSDRMGSGVRAERSTEARSFAVTILMNIWVTPDPVLDTLRNDALLYLAQGRSAELAVHWSMISAAYPFWFNVARQTGRLLALQNQVTMKQVSRRLIEVYGERQTVSRNAQFVVRSFAFWGVLKDIAQQGCYQKIVSTPISDLNLVSLMLEAALHAIPKGKGTLDLLLNNPAFFPFQLPLMTGDFIGQRREHIEIIRYGLDDELLMLKKKQGER
ncbi:hypothetical protein [Nitrosococcus watsonii]|uniref:Uncharacterized protein n=1 Tax=Nitrosococcus watsoni (strain C-113) TaxID=105559 RepID=D8K849_NITWC|nr:hypothetical protein [Nitrosococcus watsonii]ADJ27044.1 conserved hypothetical protein [Nitrosococcus watsonii C-113]